MYELYAKIMFLMGNNNSQTKAKGIISRGVGDKELEIRLSTTVFWAIYSNRHAILARKTFPPDPSSTFCASTSVTDGCCTHCRNRSICLY